MSYEEDIHYIMLCCCYCWRFGARIGNYDARLSVQYIQHICQLCPDNMYGLDNIATSSPAMYLLPLYWYVLLGQLL